MPRGSLFPPRVEELPTSDPRVLSGPSLVISTERGERREKGKRESSNSMGWARPGWEVAREKSRIGTLSRGSQLLGTSAKGSSVEYAAVGQVRRCPAFKCS